VPHDIVGMLMPPILRVFRQAHPNVLVTLVSDTSRELYTLLRDRKIDLTLTTDQQRGGVGQHLLADRLVWVGAPGGEAHLRSPLSVALGQESCGFRASAVEGLTKAGIAWRPICQVGSLEPVFATLEADMAVAPFLRRTVPSPLVVLADGVLPRLPAFHINLRLPSHGVGEIAAELARHIKEGFAERYA
jgi:DNA-binding transcriptional LysR family regulator